MLHQTGLNLRSRFRVPFTGVAAILYRNGDDFQGLHSDREMRWLDDTVIAIVVLGIRRPFVMRPRAAGGVPVERVSAGTGPDDVILTPGQGDMLIMGGACQREWLHGVPKASTDLPRVSLTWRWTRRGGRPDTSPTYYDGRHFSDGPRRAGSRSRPVWANKIAQLQLRSRWARPGYVVMGPSRRNCVTCCGLSSSRLATPRSRIVRST